MQSNVPMVKLGEVLTQNTNYIDNLEFREYAKLSVKLYGKGVCLDEPTNGRTVRMKRHQLARAGQVIVSEIWAKKGAIGIVPKEGDGALVTSHFFLFDINEERLYPQFFEWILKGNFLENQLYVEARGTTGYASVRPKKFLTCEISLPPLKEQQRIIVTLERLMAKIEEARKERVKAEKEIEHIKRSLLCSFFTLCECESQKLEDACEAIIDNLHSTPRYDGNELPCVRSQDVNDGCINFLSALKTNVDEFNERIRRAEPRSGDIVYVREGDVGRCAVVNGTQRFSLGQRVMMFRPDQSKINPKFLFYQLMSPPFHEDQVLCSMTGTTSRHVNIKDLKKMRINVPPLSEQLRIVAHLDRLQGKVDEVKRLQWETEREMEALVPAVLAKAFGG